jgi:hypothetical protein
MPIEAPMLKELYAAADAALYAAKAEGRARFRVAAGPAALSARTPCSRRYAGANRKSTTSDAADRASRRPGGQGRRARRAKAEGRARFRVAAGPAALSARTP